MSEAFVEEVCWWEVIGD